MTTGNDELLLRRLSMDILLEAAKENTFGNNVLKQVLDKYDYLDARKKAFVKKLAMGCLERQIQLDYVIDLYAKPKTAQMKPVIKAILELGAYQILFMDQVYDTTACNMCVTLARKKGFSSLAGFVNGILRRICREKEQIPWPDKKEDVCKFLHVFYSMPEWLINLLLEQYGIEKTEQILEGFRQEPEVSLRCRESLTDTERDALFDAWRKAGVSVSANTELPYACSVKGTDRISTLHGYEEGRFIVQDFSSMLVCECAGIRPGDIVMDVCAAPGGKTLHASEKTGRNGRVYAFDLTENKVARIEENKARMNADNVTAAVGDATVFLPEFEEKADVLLADVPCSGLGVVARKQDIPQHLSEEKLQSLVALQREILENVVRYVKKGGTLVYSTCTLNRMENDGNVAWIQEHLGLRPVSLENRIPASLHKYLNQDKTLQLYRAELKCDGFFIALFKKEE